MLFEDKRYPVGDGDAIYLPSGIHHQMFNTMNEEWLEHHVISMGVAEQRWLSLPSAIGPRHRRRGTVQVRYGGIN